MGQEQNAAAGEAAKQNEGAGSDQPQQPAKPLSTPPWNPPKKDPPPPPPPAPEPKRVRVILKGATLGPLLLKEGDETEDPRYVALLKVKGQKKVQAVG